DPPLPGREPFQDPPADSHTYVRQTSVCRLALNCATGQWATKLDFVELLSPHLHFFPHRLQARRIRIVGELNCVSFDVNGAQADRHCVRAMHAYRKRPRFGKMTAMKLTEKLGIDLSRLRNHLTE